jgi:hypothetical protein
MDLNNLVVTKENGMKQEFSIQKFRNSLAKSHASPQQIDQVVKNLEPKLFYGIRTREIYKLASRFLKKNAPAQSARFGLKKAIMELGPSGYPFEKLISALFEDKSYSTQVGLVLPGKCVTHEIDVIGRKNEELILVECKYRNQPGMNVDVKVPLYINSRFQDLLDNHLLTGESKRFSGWIATNSRFSDDAISFGLCKGINMLSWNFPESNSLRDWIDSSGLYPVTCLSTLTISEKKKIMESGVVLVKELDNSHELLTKIGMTDRRLLLVKKEIEELLYFVSQK